MPDLYQILIWIKTWIHIFALKDPKGLQTGLPWATVPSFPALTGCHRIINGFNNHNSININIMDWCLGQRVYTIWQIICSIIDHLVSNINTINKHNNDNNNNIISKREMEQQATVGSGFNSIWLILTTTTTTITTTNIIWVSILKGEKMFFLHVSHQDLYFLIL